MAANAKTKKYLNSSSYAEIKQDLLDQLERTGTVGKYYTDLVNDYMDMWVTKCLLVDDIQQRGVNIKYNNGGGQSGVKKNDSIEQRIKVNAQMLKLLSELGIKPAQTGGEDDEEM
ncbi:phage terminase, small subunit [Clostridium aceticum]|uniref:Phage terminase, small subunit n=1 Tax=Clostridium aceticum TaxID=84022 RepID=A0A0G3WGQ0_9CLOT|nr:P27 family phage terminase small subunit [Clostridium aceticum]AKL96634.1 phage terminase, small subunit [Clostridium aceticum]